MSTDNQAALIDAIYSLDIHNRSAKQMAVRILTKPQVLLGALNGLDRQTPQVDACVNSCAVVPAGAADRASLIASAQAFLALAKDNALTPRVPSMALSLIDQLASSLAAPTHERAAPWECPDHPEHTVLLADGSYKCELCGLTNERAAPALKDDETANERAIRQALEVLASEDEMPERVLTARRILRGAVLIAEAERAAPAPEELTTCNCRWRGDELVQQCTLHEAWKDTLHEYAEELRHLRATPSQPVAAEGVTDAARDVLAERRRQVEAESWTPEHDDAHAGGEMAMAAACYAAHTSAGTSIHQYELAGGGKLRLRSRLQSAQEFVRSMWPWARQWWKPAEPRRNLVKAGALILAEIERIDRAALSGSAESKGNGNG